MPRPFSGTGTALTILDYMVDKQRERERGSAWNANNCRYFNVLRESNGSNNVFVFVANDSNFILRPGWWFHTFLEKKRVPWGNDPIWPTHMFQNGYFELVSAGPRYSWVMNGFHCLWKWKMLMHGFHCQRLHVWIPPQKSNIDTNNYCLKGVHLFQPIVLGIHVSFQGSLYLQNWVVFT